MTLTLNVSSPVSSQDSPMMEKQCALIAPRMVQIEIAGIQPVPEAMPAESVKIPAPATLLTKLKTDANIVAFPCSFCSPPLVTLFTGSVLSLVIGDDGRLESLFFQPAFNGLRIEGTLL